MPRSLKKARSSTSICLGEGRCPERDNTKQVIKTWPRGRPSFRTIGHTFAVHDSRKHVPVFGSPNRW